MDTGGVKIVKVGDTSSKPMVKPKTAGTRKSDHSKKPKFGILKKGKTARSKPRFEAVRDPTSAPPMRKSLRILTTKGEKTRRNKISEDAKKLPIHVIRATLKKNKLPVTGGNDALHRAVYEDAQAAGMLSV